MNEEVSDRTVRVAVRVTEISLRHILRGLKEWAREQRNKRLNKKSIDKSKEVIKGKQSVKELIGQGQGVSSMEVGDSGIRDFKKIANKYGVDFAIVKDKDTDPPKYTVFFKARDADAITQVLKEYAAKQTKKKERAEKERPSILKKLKAFKEKVASMPRKDKEKRKEMER